MPGVRAESGSAGAGLLSGCGGGGGGGGGGGDGVAALGELGDGDGGFVGRLLFTGPSSSPAPPPTSEPVCTAGRDSTLGQSSSSLT